MELKGKVALITGGARLGVFVARALAREGIKLILSYRKSRSIAEKIAKEVGGVTFQADCSREKDVKKLFAFIKWKFGSLDILIAMASTFGKTPFSTLNKHVWDREMKNTLTTSFLCAKAAASLIHKKGGKIILIGDAKIPDHPYRGRLPYLVAKAGVHMLTKVLALELSPKILVNCVAPGLVLPQKNMSPQEKRRIGKWGNPNDVTSAILHLLKNDSVTGKIIRVAP